MAGKKGNKRRTSGTTNRIRNKFGIYGVAAATIGAVGAIAAGAANFGPDEFWLSTKALFGIYPPPVIVRVEPAATPDGPAGSFLVTIQNPSHEPVTVIGYGVRPSDFEQAASLSTGEAPAVRAKDEPKPCSSGPREERLDRSVVVAAKETLDLFIRPWVGQKLCIYELSLRSTHGNSDPVLVIPGAYGGAAINPLTKEQWENLRQEIGIQE